MRRTPFSPLLRLLNATLICALAVSGQTPTGNMDAQVDQLYVEAKSLQASGDLAGAADKYEAILKLSPKLGPAYNNLGMLYFKQRDFPKAAAVLEKGLKVNPGMPSAHALLGISLYEMADYAGARPHLEVALRANPDDSNAELILVNCLTKIGDFDSAAKHLQQLAKRQPKNQQVWYLMGKVYIQLSEQALEKVNAIDPNSIWAHQVASEMAESMKNYDGAILELKKALEIAPRQPGLHFKLGDLYWVQRQWEPAFGEFQIETTIDPHNCMARWKLGNVLVQQSVRPEEALDDLTQALTACPSLVDARLDRGSLLLKMQRPDEALPDLLAVAKAQPDESRPHFLLAQAYRALGRTADSQAEMKTFSVLEERARTATAERAKEAIQSKEKPQ
ncbi:MAG: tetratricopeptide repeat protein [Bryobacteraceae bacterium]